MGHNHLHALGEFQQSVEDLGERRCPGDRFLVDAVDHHVHQRKSHLRVDEGVPAFSDAASSTRTTPTAQALARCSLAVVAAVEKLAGMEHWRADYLAGSQFTHATPWGAELSAEAGAVVTYWRITGLGDPLSHVLTSLLQLVRTVVFHGSEANFYDLVAFAAICHLVGAAEELVIPSECKASRQVENSPPT